MLRRMRKQNNHTPSIQSFQDLINVMRESDDFQTLQFGNSQQLSVYYYHSLIDTEKLQTHLLPYTNNIKFKKLEELKNVLPFDETEITSDLQTIESKLLDSHIGVTLGTRTNQVLLIPAKFNSDRNITQPEIEFSVIGPKLAFIENLQTNVNLIRRRVKLPQLQVKTIEVGKVTKTKVAVVYIDGIANKENVDTVKQRIKDIEYDQIIDSSFIAQMITDNSQSPFPQLMDTERPDRISSALIEGKVAIICDGSPHVISAPTTLVEFFASYEDYFLNSYIATAFRLIRIFAVLFSVLITPMYVAVLTYHYQIVPIDLLGTLISSRRDIPFPPVIEVIILELTIELLREAGARLPTKIGQTIGIVGGIVIGTAAVEAGLTSNVLLILVALAALASFTTPIYRIGNTIRLLRFPFIIFAQMWGMVGVIVGLMFTMCHLLRLTSIGRPFTEPFFPPRWRDLKDAFIRFPFEFQGNRPIFTSPNDKKRMNLKRTIPPKDKRK
ncbi:spore germination protein [Gracilibacillus halophilus YIM-C55.5]|uniref:Spore germination protein n=1 Tax=Gracilibacillus halophilus YIM-C55.5 TaxID=1308866 RepID=N4WKW0_9BACI|nr:spore germination protein [Gracilibacillus halophilus]ENH96807.1 spore germination protein [Gracilibacillus halophilus YIM-C55.5]